MSLTHSCVHDSRAILVLTDVVILYLITTIIPMDNFIDIERCVLKLFSLDKYTCTYVLTILYNHVQACMFILA